MYVICKSNTYNKSSFKINGIYKVLKTHKIGSSSYYYIIDDNEHEKWISSYCFIDIESNRLERLNIILYEST